MVYWLVLCCNKIGACVLLYGWPCCQKASGQFDCNFAHGLMKRSFHTVREGKILYRVQMDNTDSKIPNEAGDSNAGT